MIKLSFKVPRTVTVAFSGGVDSTAVVDFLSQNHNVSCAFFHHGTENSDKAFTFVNNFCKERELQLVVCHINKPLDPKKSKEEHWRDERYAFLEMLPGPVITAHNLNDCVETYIMSALHGSPKVIPFRRNNVIRPFLTTEKKEFVDWCQRKQVPWCEDESNQNNDFMRNHVRNVLLPHALKVNPGLFTTVKKIVEKQDKMRYTDT